MKLIRLMYQFLFVDQKSNTLSHTKFWSQIGYAVMCWAFVFVILEGKTAIDASLWLVFGSVVIGNRTAAKALNTFTQNKKEDKE